MALSRSTYSVPGTPRVYIDNLLYGRAVGMVFDQPGLNAKITNAGSDSAIQDTVGVDPRLLWDLDPLRTSSINFSSLPSNTYQIYSKLRFIDSGDEFQKLVSTSNYAAVLAHNLNSVNSQTFRVRVWGEYMSGGISQNSEMISASSIVGNFDEDVTSDGFILSEIDPTYDIYNVIAMRIDPSTSGEEFSEGSETLSIGSFSFGTYLDFPNSPDLNVKQSISHDGVSTTRTLAGKDLTNIRYSGAPNWGDLPPFTNTKADTYNYKGTGFTGRKSWDMKFSYVDKTDMFNSIMSGSSAGTNFRIVPVGESSYEDGFRADESIVGTYLSRTLGGSLKHVLQPDNTKDEFHFVKLDQNSTDIQQVAHGVFDISLKFIQVW